MRCRAAGCFEVAGRAIGKGQPCFVIAEAGVNHNGSLDLAFQLIEAAAGAGADAVKFQTFNAEALACGTSPKARYQCAAGPSGETQAEMLKRLELPDTAWRKLKTHAESKSLIFLSTPFDEKSARLLLGLGVPAFKLSSGEVTNLPFLRLVAGFGRPVILSTGMSTMCEVDQAVAEMRHAGADRVVLLHCVSEYPARPQDLNLRAMVSLARRFQVPVGFSDHTAGVDAAIAAVALGACVIEKHLTTDRALPGPDHRASETPAGFRGLVKHIRMVEAALGDGLKRPSGGERETAAVARRSLVAARDIRAGAVVRAADIVLKRPGTGLPPAQLAAVAGRRATTAIMAGTLLEMDMFE